MGQLKYNLSPIPGLPGQLMDLNSIGPADIVSAVAATTIPPGVMCELNSSGLLQPLQDTHGAWPPSGAMNANTNWGVSVYDLAGFEQGYFSFPVPPSTAGSTGTGYPKGAVVPVLKKGRIWVLSDGGGTALRAGAVNVWHSSDGTHNQGVFTFSAPAVTAGAEIDVAIGVTAYNPTGQAGSYTDGFGTAFVILGASVNIG